MKILLVKPPSDMHVEILPIGLGYIASYLRKQIDNISVQIIDCLSKRFNHNQLLEYIYQTQPDVVGITAFTMDIQSALMCCDLIKASNKEIVTVIGGPHASSVPEKVLGNEQVDFVFRTEAEIGFSELILELRNGKNYHKVTNLGYKEGGKMKFNPIQFPLNIDEFPYPDYELMNFENYPKTYMAKKHPYAPIITSRGCPYRCTYCSARKLSGKKFRARKPENIVAELQYLKEKYKIKEFQVWDDNFTLDKKRAHKFCDLLLEKKINLPWWCPNGLRMETLDEELIKKLKHTGLYAMALGIESGSEKIQKDMKKKINFHKLKGIIELGNKYKIRMQGFFILGYPTETREDMEKTIKLMKELPLKRASILLFQPLVGTEIYSILEKEGKLDQINENLTEYSKPSILPKGLDSLEELKIMQKKAILGFYLRPKVLSNFILENLSPDQMKEVGKMVKKYIFHK